MTTKNPSLYYGLFLVFGACAALGTDPWLLLMFLPLLLVPPRQLVRGLIVALAMALYTLTLYQHPPGPVEGAALIKITDIQTRGDIFGEQIRYKGRVVALCVGEEVVARNLPVTIRLPRRETLETDKRWLVEGELIPRPGGYTFKVGRGARWEAVGKSWNLARVRYAWRRWLRGLLRARFRRRVSAVFLAGMVTGEFVDPSLSASFNRLSLQHLMAISGFHFSLMAGLIALVLRPFGAPRRAAAGLALALSTYFLLVGTGAAVQRAWVMAAAGLTARALGMRIKASTAFGMALVVAVVWEPLCVGSLGFQFSFGCTAALLALQGPIYIWMGRFIGRYSMDGVMRMGVVDQGAAAFLAIIRRAVSLMVAVNVVAAPLTLFYFKTFPLLGLVYNLFFPCLVALAMVAMPVCLLLGPWGWAALDGFTTWTLDFVRYVPAVLSFDLKLEYFPTWTLGVATCLLTLLMARPILALDESTRSALLPVRNR